MLLIWLTQTNDKIFTEKRKYNVSIADFITDVDDLIFITSTATNNKLLYKATAHICPISYTSLGILAGTRHKNLDKQV